MHPCDTPWVRTRKQGKQRAACHRQMECVEQGEESLKGQSPVPAAFDPAYEALLRAHPSGYLFLGDAKPLSDLAEHLGKTGCYLTPLPVHSADVIDCFPFPGWIHVKKLAPLEEFKGLLVGLFFLFGSWIFVKSAYRHHSTFLLRFLLLGSFALSSGKKAVIGQTRPACCRQTISIANPLSLQPTLRVYDPCFPWQPVSRSTLNSLCQACSKSALVTECRSSIWST